MSDYYISVFNGLLEKKHMDAMKVSNKSSGIWMYLWFLDKVTQIDEKSQLGKVLGGKPIRLEDIDLPGDIKTKRKIFHRLVESGYIEATRTPYGHVIYVTKAKKVFGMSQKKYVEKSQNRTVKSGRSWGTNVVGLGSKSGRSNKTIQLDNTIRQRELKISGLKTAGEMPDLSNGFYERFNKRTIKTNNV